MSNLSNTAHVVYSDTLEQKEENEEAIIAELNQVVHRSQAVLTDRYRHGVRFAHSKSHGILKAEFSVTPNLPTELSQGLFSASQTYPAIIRFSTAPGDLMADSMSTPRGMAVKVLGVDSSKMLPENVGQSTQDFVFVNSKSFAAPDIKTFLGLQKLIEKNLNDPEFIKKVASKMAQGTNAAIGLVGAHSTILEQIGAPETHLLGETYGSNAAIRYGDYVAKIIFTPRSENLKALTGKHVAVNFHYSALRDAVVDFFKTETAVWEIGVQLCSDLAKMPIEDPSKPWPEDISPYRAVGTLTARPQDAYSSPRRVYADDMLSFNPWHALAAHRPLGRINRARQSAYNLSSGYRRDQNGRPITEPRDIAEFPD